MTIDKKLVKVSDLILDFLTEKGITQCFSVTGGGAMHLNDSFGHSSNLRVTYNHHEQASAIAAEGYARLLNKPAMVCITSGPGVANAITGVQGAWLDSIPMFVVSGQMRSDTTLQSTNLPLRYLGFQESDTGALVRSFTKYFATVSHVDELYFHLNRAFDECQAMRKGPVWLDIPLDVQGALIANIDAAGQRKSFVPIDSSQRHELSTESIERIYKLLNESNSPVFMLGEEVRLSDAKDDVIKLAEKLSIPVVTEWNAHDLIEDDHRLACGRPGTIGNRGGNFVVQNCDLIFLIGCQLSIRQVSYEWTNFAKNATKIGVSVDLAELSKKTVVIQEKLNMSVNSFANQLFGYAHKLTRKFDPWLQWCKKINAKYPVCLDKFKNEDLPLNVYSFLDELSDATSGDHVIVLANGAACVCGLQGLKVKAGQRIFTNAGSSGMGYGICAAIGAAASGRPVICIEGDGSIMMNLAELQTIKTNNADIKIFLLNNQGYHSIKQTQNNIFSAQARGYCGADSSSGVEFPDFSRLAEAFSLRYFCLDHVNSLSAIPEILQTKGPLLCEVVVDPDQDFQPKLISKMRTDGSFHTPSLEDMYPFLSKDEMTNNIYQVKSEGA